MNEKIESEKWYELSVEIRGNEIIGYIGGRKVLEYAAEKPVEGLVGLWTKADSVTYFDDFAIKTDQGEKIISF